MVKALEVHNWADIEYYARQQRDLDDEYFSILAGYAVSDKMKPIKAEMLKSIDDYRSSSNNQINAANAWDSGDMPSCLDYLNRANDNLDDANAHTNSATKM